MGSRSKSSDKVEELRELNNKLDARNKMLLESSENILEKNTQILADPSLLFKNVPKNSPSKSLRSFSASGSFEKRFVKENKNIENFEKQEKNIHTKLSHVVKNGETNNKSVDKLIERDLAYLNNEISSDNEDDFSKLLEGIKVMNQESQLKFLRTKISLMNKEITAMKLENGAKEKELKKLEGEVKNNENEKNNLKRINNSLDSKMGRLTKSLEQMTRDKQDLNLELQVLKKEKELLEKVDIGTGRRKKKEEEEEKRIGRIEEENSSFKSLNQNLKIEIKDLKEKNEEIVKDLKDELKSLKRNHGFLLEAFKKQMRLIDVYKKQIIHMEALKSLSFTEDEFNSLISTNQKL